MDSPTVESCLISLSLTSTPAVHRHEDSAEAERSPTEDSVVPCNWTQKRRAKEKSASTSSPSLTLHLNLPIKESRDPLCVEDRANSGLIRSSRG